LNPRSVSVPGTRPGLDRRSPQSWAGSGAPRPARGVYPGGAPCIPGYGSALLKKGVGGRCWHAPAAAKSYLNRWGECARKWGRPLAGLAWSAGRGIAAGIQWISTRSFFCPMLCTGPQKP